MKALVLLALSFAASVAAVAGREFEDTFGRMITADLVAHWGPNADHVKISKGGVELTVRVDAFAEKHAKEIRQWMRDNPEKLVAMTDPPHSGEDVISGSKWIYLRSNGSRIHLEFRGASKLMKNGVLSRSGRWVAQEGKYLRFRWSGGGDHLFTFPVIAKRLYRDRNSASVAIRLDRLPVKRPVESFYGRAFVLYHSNKLVGWVGKGADRTALVELEAEGKAHFAGTGVSTTWRLEGVDIVLRRPGGSEYAFRPHSRDIFIQRNAYVLWEVQPPDEK